MTEKFIWGWVMATRKKTSKARGNSGRNLNRPVDAKMTVTAHDSSRVLTFEMRVEADPRAGGFAVDFVRAYAFSLDVEMSEVQAAVRQPQPVAFLLELYVARASCG